MKLRIIHQGIERIHEVREHETLITIGRAPGNDIVLSDEKKASRKQCQVEKLPEGWRLRDMGSAYGTNVNGMRVPAADLRLGDRIQIGDTVIYFGEPAPVKKVAAPTPQPVARPAVAPARNPIQAAPRQAMPNNMARPERLANDGRNDSPARRPRSEARELAAMERAPKRGSNIIGFMVTGAVFAFLAILGIAYYMSTQNHPPVEPIRPVAGPTAADLMHSGPQADPLREQAEREWQAIVHDPDVPAKERPALLHDLVNRYIHATFAGELRQQLREYRESLPTLAQEELAQVVMETYPLTDAHQYGDAILLIRAFLDDHDDEMFAVETWEDGVRAIEQEILAQATEYYEEVLIHRANDLLDLHDFAAVERLYEEARDENFHHLPYLVARCDERLRILPVYVQMLESPEPPDAAVERRMRESPRERQPEPESQPEPVTQPPTQTPTGPDPSQIEGYISLADEAALLATTQTTLIKACQRAEGFELSDMVIEVRGTRAGIETRTDAERLYYRLHGARVPRPWDRVAPELVLELYTRIRPQKLEVRWGTAIYAYNLGDIDQAALTLGQLYLDQPELKDAIDVLIARHRGMSVPDGGFVAFSPSGRERETRLIHPDELDLIMRQREAEEILGQLETALDELLEAQLQGDATAELETTINGMIARLTELGGTAEPVIEQIVEAINLRIEHILSRIAPNDRSVLRGDTLTRLQEARQEALMRIRDENRYPYDGNNHGARCLPGFEGPNGETYGQPWVDEAVDAVRAIWEEAQRDTPSTGLVTQIQGLINLMQRLDPNDRFHSPADNQAFLQQAMWRMEGNQIMRDNEFADRGRVTDEEVRHVAIVNEYRIMMGLRPVRINYLLCEASRSHSEYMKSSGQFAHNIPGHPDGAGPGDRAQRVGYSSGVGENIAMNSGGHSAQSSFNAWYNSSGHHRNMLGANWRVMGVGSAGTHWTQMFGGSQTGDEPAEN